MKRFLIALTMAGLIFGATARAEGPDDIYVRIYKTIEQADELNQTGQKRTAYERYTEAQAALKRLHVTHPDWNPGLVQFRLDYLSRRLAEFTEGAAPATPLALPQIALPQAAPPSPTEAPKAEQPEKPVDPAELQAQIKNLSNENRRLGADKATLEAKLREALSAQPATIDPRELAKADLRIKELEKENAVLKVTLEQAQAKVTQAPLSPELAETKKSLEEAQNKVAEQAKTIALLTQEKQVLESKLQKATQTAPAAPPPAVTSTTAPTPPAVPAATNPPVSNTQLALIQAENEILKKSVSDLERKLRNQSATSSTVESSSDKTSAKQVKRLERERADLLRKLDAANQELVKAKSKKGGTARLENQIASLQARLDALEARKVPYTAAELALLKPQMQVAAQAIPEDTKPAPPEDSTKAVPQPPATPTSSATAEPTKTTTASNASRELPAGVGALMADAQRDFAAHRYDDAEKKYRQVLSQDENNVVTLTHLAVLELDRNRLDAAESFAKKALAQDANDSKNLALLGIVKVRQKKFDEAMDPLSRSVKLNPSYALAQNYLGIVLVEKGQRQAAEAAFRKAIQLDPEYPNAHHNLAYVYATENPPSRELAKWHYQKAVSGGEPRNEELEKLLESKK